MSEKSRLGCGTVPALLGRAEKATWGLLGIAAACFGLLALPQASGAGPQPTLTQLQADDANLAAKSRSAVLELYSLDSRLAAARARLAALRGEMQTLRAERTSIAHQIGLARLDARISQDRLAARLRFVYEHGSTTSLDILMGATSLDDAMTQLDEFNRVAAANHEVLVQVRSSRGRLSRLSRELSLRRRALAGTTQAAADTVAALGREQAQRAAYVAQLGAQRALDSAQIARLNARARAATVLSERLSPPAPSPAPAPAPAVPEPSIAVPLTRVVVPVGGRTLTVTATGYDLSGTTSTGLPVGWGVAAVDPSVIPLGTHLVIPGYGDAIAADTGPSVTGSTIDLWFPSAAQAYSWGRRTVTISVD